MNPQENEVEVTLIGTGGGYGESILLKIGLNSWIIIDSCINPFTKKPLALEYLRSIEVDTKNVLMVICTHWHNDHIKGLAQVLLECPNAEFCFSAVHDLRKFLYLCELDYTKSKKGSISSTNEFADCLSIINDRGQYFTKAQSDLVLFQKVINEVDFTLYSLSPSSKTLIDFDQEISELITQFGERNVSIINKSPNDKSVALLLKFNNNRILLGADLEVGRDEHEGWRHIIKYSKVVDSVKADLYKIPHHGSQNGYISEIFDNLVKEDSVLKLTPYKSNGLPTIEMLGVYSKHSNSIYSTSPFVNSKKPKKRDNTIDKIISRSVVSIQEVKFTHGIVRSRIDYTNIESTWYTEVFEAGTKIL